MNTNRNAHKARQAFTIVELLIVIVVIGILAAITIVAYNGIQARATDSRIKSAASHIEKSVRLWYTDTSTNPLSGYGSNGPATDQSCPMSAGNNGGGWFSSGIYSCSLEDLLVKRNILPANYTSTLPVNAKYENSSSFTFMWYPCGSISRWVLFYYLKSPTPDDVSAFAAAHTTCGIGNTLRDTYGMQGAEIINFQ